ncbi:DUF1958 domain-containing protein [Vagococcus acidifermentans]|uniref:DUF1958 domain-containing protein n=1 Tax=Vagococcus acidifermentans TaxID=564710 RepID=UPI000F86D0CA|nr:DUF1958 domain-containing protein [Vagococcus acidifermentans]
MIRYHVIIRRVILGILTACLVGLTTDAARAEGTQKDIMTITREAGYQVNEFYRPKASMVIDAKTGRVLWEDNADTQRHIASMSKLMTIFVVLEEMQKGQFDFDTAIDVTEKYVTISQDYNLSNNKMQLGASYSVGELIDLIFVPSSNAATLMLADFVSSDSGARFAKMMNEKAQEIGMTQTVFYNSTGVINFELGSQMPEGADPNGDNISTARDYSLLAYHLLKKYPDMLEHTKNRQITVKEGTPYEESFDSYLYSLPGKTFGYDGFDGLKSGSSSSAGFNYVGTAQKGNMRLIQLIMGVGDWDHQESESERHKFGNALLDLCFNTYEYKQIVSQGEQTINEQHLVVADDLYDIVPKGTQPEAVVKDGRVTVQSSLPLVSDKIEPPQVSYEVVRKQLLQSSDKQAAKSFNLLKIGLIVFLFFTILLLVYELSASKGRRTKKNKPVFLFKCLLLLLLIGGSIIVSMYL